jgi:hypothetical protein
MTGKVDQVQPYVEPKEEGEVYKGDSDDVKKLDVNADEL